MKDEIKDYYDMRALIHLGYHTESIMYFINLLLGPLGCSDPHTDLLYAITPLKSAFSRLTTKKKSKEILKTLDTMYSYFVNIRTSSSDEEESSRQYEYLKEASAHLKSEAREIANYDLSAHKKLTSFRIGQRIALWDKDNRPSKCEFDEIDKMLRSINLNKCANFAKYVYNLHEKYEYSAIGKVFYIMAEAVDEIEGHVISLSTNQSSDIQNLSELTNLPNLTQFKKDLAVRFSRIQDDGPLSLCFIDIDNFKALNTNIGHDVADEVIVELANHLKKSANKRGEVYHRSGDEFLVIMLNTTGSEAKFLIERIIDSISERVFNTSKGVQKITVSAGISEGSSIKSIEDLMHESNQMMTKSKNDGKCRASLFSQKKVCSEPDV